MSVKRAVICLDRLAKYFIILYLEYMILHNAILWYYTFGQFHGNVTLVTKYLIYRPIFENNKSYVQNEAHFRRVRWEINYCTKRWNILTRLLVDFYVTNIRLLWKCPSRLRHSFITTLFLRSLWWCYNRVLLYFMCINLSMYHSSARTVTDVSKFRYWMPW
jgi:hypothetical protein